MTTNKALPRVKILLVDDNPANLLSLEVALEAPDYAFVRARSGFEAVRLVDWEDFAAILLDIQMPGMDGYETARRIKSLPRGRDVPIIFVTAVFTREDDIRKSYEAGGIDYLTKPLIADVIRAKVRIYADLYRKTRELGAMNELLARLQERLTAENRPGIETLLDPFAQ